MLSLSHMNSQHDKSKTNLKLNTQFNHNLKVNPELISRFMMEMILSCMVLKSDKLIINITT